MPASSEARFRRLLPIAAWMVMPGLIVGSAVLAQEKSLAIYKAQEIRFNYTSSTSVYTCGALRSRVESLLSAVGAEDIKLSVSGCTNFFFPDEFSSPQRRGGSLRFRNRDPDSRQFATVRISLRSPIAATPEALAELEKTKGYRELLGRVTGSSAVVQEAAAQFPVQRQVVPLNSRTLDLESEECELLEQFTRQVYPKLGVSVIEDTTSCFPGQVSLIKPRLKVEALLKVPPPAAPDAATAPVAEQPANSTPQPKP